MTKLQETTDDGDPPPETPEDVINDLRKVGPHKPLGYLPIRAITSFCGVPLALCIRDVESKGLAWRRYDPEECHTQSGALYVWDREALQTLINANASILAASEWPILADEFVHSVATTTVFEAKNPALYELIGIAFADDRFVRPQLVKRGFQP